MSLQRDSRVPSSSDRAARPAVVDEWGIYDPAQAGIAALFERLGESEPAMDVLDAAAIAVSIENAHKLTSQ